MCNVQCFEEKYIFNINGATFNLEKSKVTDVCMKTDVEIHNQYVSSAGGAVAGALLFGPLGAMIGGRTKEKKNKVVSTYLIFTYIKDDSLTYICFDVSNYIVQSGKLVDEFKMYSNKGKLNIEL